MGTAHRLVECTVSKLAAAVDPTGSSLRRGVCCNSMEEVAVLCAAQHMHAYFVLAAVWSAQSLHSAASQ